MMYNKILDYAYFLLSKKDYTEKELLNKIKNRFPNGTGFFDSIIEKLKSYDYINDDRYFKNFVKMKINNGYGAYYIKTKLHSKGIYKEIDDIENIINENINYKKIIKELIRKKKYSNKKYDKIQLKKKYFDFLIRRGFDISNIKVVLDEELKDESNFS